MKGEYCSDKMNTFVMTILVMNTFGIELRARRLANSLKINELARLSGVDASLISRYESDSRTPSDKHITMLAHALGIDEEVLRSHYLISKVVKLLRYEPAALDVLIAAEKRIEYLSSANSTERERLSQDIEERLTEVDELQKRWLEQKPLNAVQLQKMIEYFTVEYTYESNRIEGNTLTLKETDLVVNQGLTISGKSMNEHLEAINHAEASDYIRDLIIRKEDINKRTLLEIHGIVLKSIDRLNAGRYRTVNVRISGSEHIPPEHVLVEDFMKDYFVYYERNKSRTHPVILAAEMHERLVSIHPFVDGNGRTARLVMNLILLRHGYTIANLKGDLSSRLRYYKTLEDIQVHNAPDDFYNVIIDAVVTSLSRHLELS